MNILVTGANGQLGMEMRNVVAGSNDNYMFTDVAELDIIVRHIRMLIRRKTTMQLRIRLIIRL